MHLYQQFYNFEFIIREFIFVFVEYNFQQF
jgi:hypothetical protein